MRCLEEDERLGGLCAFVERGVFQDLRDCLHTTAIGSKMRTCERTMTINGMNGETEKGSEDSESREREHTQPPCEEQVPNRDQLDEESRAAAWVATREVKQGITKRHGENTEPEQERAVFTSLGP